MERKEYKYIIFDCQHNWVLVMKGIVPLQKLGEKVYYLRNEKCSHCGEYRNVKYYPDE